MIYEKYIITNFTCQLFISYMANVKNKNVQFVYDKKNNRVVTKKNINATKKVLLYNTAQLDIVSQKEKNKQRYEARKRKYSNAAAKKKIVNPELETKDETNKIKVTKVYKSIEDKYILKERIECKIKEETEFEEVVPKKKTINLTSTFTLIKDKSKDVIDNVKQKTTDENIPFGNLKEDKKKRIKRYFKEAFIYSLIITVINVIIIKVFDYTNWLKIFDLKWLNIAVTVILSLIVNYIFAVFVDSLLTEIWIVIKNKHNKKGDMNGSNRIIKGKDKENIKDKERE